MPAGLQQERSQQSAQNCLEVSLLVDNASQSPAFWSKMMLLSQNEINWNAL